MSFSMLFSFLFPIRTLIESLKSAINRNFPNAGTFHYYDSIFSSSIYLPAQNCLKNSVKIAVLSQENVTCTSCSNVTIDINCKQVSLLVAISLHVICET